MAERAVRRVKEGVMADFGQTDFGQTDFGQPFLLPSLAKPTLARVSVLVVWPTLAKTDFGQLWPKPTLAKVGLAKVGLAKVGRITMAKVGLAKVGFGRRKGHPRNFCNPVPMKHGGVLGILLFSAKSFIQPSTHCCTCWQDGKQGRTRTTCGHGSRLCSDQTIAKKAG